MNRNCVKNQKQSSKKCHLPHSILNPDLARFLFVGKYVSQLFKKMISCFLLGRHISVLISSVSPRYLKWKIQMTLLLIGHFR